MSGTRSVFLGAVLVMGAGKSYQIAQGLKAALEGGVLSQSRSLSDR